MPVLIGELEKITGSPSSVTQVMVRAHETRITGAALTTDELVPIPVDRDGRFEVNLRPGKAVMVLVHGGRVGEGERFPLLVEEGLGTIVSAIKLASDKFDDYELDELERAAADMLASLDKGLVAATRAETAQKGAETAQGDAEKARDKAGEHRDGAEKAAGTAAAEAAEGAVQKADEKLSRYVTDAKGYAENSAGSSTSAAKDANRAETARQGAETIEKNLPTKVVDEIDTQLPAELREQLPDELATQLPAELDERVPPKVAEAIAADRAVADAAAAAVDTEVEGLDLMKRTDAESLIAEGLPWKGILPDATDMNMVREPGVYTVESVASARTMINWPTVRAGIIKVSTNEGVSMTSQEVTAYVSTTSAVEKYSRATLSIMASNWSPWMSDAWNQGAIPDGTNLNTWRNAGAFQITSLTSSRTMGDMPVEDDGTTRIDGPATVETMVGVGTSRSLQRITVEHDEKMREFTRSSLSTASWPAWQEMGKATAPTDPAPGGGGGAAVASASMSDHASRVEYARSRRGGGIGTGGKAVVMLRFDHWLVAFRDEVLPILRKHQLPATLNMNYDNISNPQNGGGEITWEHVQDWNQYDGIEIANHGSTHRNPDTAEGIYHEIVNGRRNLEAAMPRVAVETWHEHGSAYLKASDIEGDIGLDIGRRPENFFESYAGKLVLAEHAIIEGKSGGFFHPINGHPQIGQSHYSADRSTAAEAIQQATYAQTFGKAITLYTHPGSMNNVVVGGKYWPYEEQEDGSYIVTNPADNSTQTFADWEAMKEWAEADGNWLNMSFKDFDVFCAHLAAERDAGRLMVMTAAGGGFADKSHDRRENLLVKPDFTEGYTDWWIYMAGWTVNNPGPNVTLTSSASAQPISQGMLLYTRFGWAMGAAHELLVTVSAEVETTLTLRGEKMGDPDTWFAERTFTVPGDGVPRDYRLNISLPRDTSITQMRWYIGGPSMTIHGAPLLAAI